LCLRHLPKLHDLSPFVFATFLVGKFRWKST